MKLFNEIADDIAAAGSPQQCLELFREAVAPFGVTAFACGHVDLAVRERNVFYLIDWPESWRKFYLRSGLLQRDPLLDELGRRQTPFTFSELRAERKLPPLGTEALRLSAELGWTEGLAAPIPQSGRHCGLVSLIGPRGVFTDDEKRRLAYLSVGLYTRARALAPAHGCAVAPAGLTKREIECLGLTARGFTDGAIGKQLALSSETVREHVEKARKKLKTSSRVAAVAIGVAIGIIAP